MKSKIGFILILLYTITTAYLYWSNLSCNGYGCGLLTILPIMPWPFVFESLFQLSLPIYIIFVIINGGILYFIGLGITKLTTKKL